MSPAGALEGVRVLDFTRHIPGPYATMLLGDFGADVVKVEAPPLGDPARLVPPLSGAHGAAFAAVNRNKRSIVVDLRAPSGAAVLRRLASRADVLVEGFRPGILARRGLGSEDLLAESPRLVYCSLSGYGPRGPIASRAGHDINYLARSGVLDANRDAEGRPVIPKTQIADMTGGLLAVIGILAALQARERTGRGQVVDSSLFEGSLALLTVPAARAQAAGTLANELTGTHACYNVYRCKDGRYLSVGALEPAFWEALCLAVGLPESEVSRQWSGGQETREALARAFASRDRDDWVQRLASVDACVDPVFGLEEALAQPQAQRMVRPPQPHLPIRVLGNPLHLSATPCRDARPAPGLGEHTEEVLEEAGYSADERAGLRRTGVIP